MEHKFLITLVVPIALLCVGSIGKRVVRGPGWVLDDLYLGLEAAIAGLTGGMTYILDVVKALHDRYQAHAGDEIIDRTMGNLLATGLFVTLAFCLYLYLLSVHQDWENRATPNPTPEWWRFWARRGGMLGILSNGIGFGVLVCFLLLIKTEV